ncbi:MAG: hypothetical protein ACM3JG_06285 [Thiohalocapsa sp.]
MPSSIDLPLSSAGEYNAPMAFRRQRYWFLSFVMTPFKDVEPRTVDDRAARGIGKRGR